MGPWLVHSRQGAEKPDDRSLDEPFLLAKSAKYLVGTRPYSKPMRKEYWRLAIRIIVAIHYGRKQHKTSGHLHPFTVYLEPEPIPLI